MDRAGKGSKKKKSWSLGHIRFDSTLDISEIEKTY